MNPLASQPASSTADSSAAAAALKGASLAFQKKPPAPPPKKKDNGALTAATTSVSRPRSPAPAIRQHDTGESEAEMGGLAAVRLGQLQGQQMMFPGMGAGGGHTGNKLDPKSPSFIAATLAASRSASPTPKARTPGRRQSVGTLSATGSVEAVDSASLAPMGNLISMFEQARAGGDPVKKLSPKRSPAGSTEDLHEKDTPLPKTRTPRPVSKLKARPRPRSMSPAAPQIISTSTPEVLSPKPKRLATPRLRPATPPDTSTRVSSRIFSPPSPDPVKKSPSLKPRPQRQERAPTPPKPRGGTKPILTTTVSPKGPVLKPKISRPRIKTSAPSSPMKARPTTAGSLSSDDTFVSASSAPSPTRDSPPTGPLKKKASTATLPPSPIPEQAPSKAVAKAASTAPTPPPTRRRRPTNSSTPNLPLDSLANAIVAGSLASARLTPHNTGTNLAPPPLPKRQKSPRLMQTLRQPPKIEDEDSDRHKKGHLSKLHSGKHSHHEGSRKKWRDEITPRERKRYEAVWASNRGLLLDMLDPATLDAVNAADAQELVVNLVVREIWKRSRLPADELAEVWDLVDRKGRGVLGRAEFVVGMWLIDQRLRGRKIPAKVTDSVWGSANGMRVVKPKVK